MDVRDAVSLARRLVREHGLDGWTVVLDNAKTRAGVCRFGTRQIGLSRPLTALHDEEHVRDTILHEIAHALVGPTHGHDAVWRRTARTIGCSGTRCLPADAPVVVGSWVGRCPAGHEVTRHRRPRRVTSCTRCARRFSPAHLLTWTHRGCSAPMHPAFVAEFEAIQRRHPGLVRPAAETGHGGGGGRAMQPDLGKATMTPEPAPPSLTMKRFELGDAARITAPGRYHGVTGIVEGLGSARHQVRVTEGILAVPVELLEVLAG